MEQELSEADTTMPLEYAPWYHDPRWEKQFDYLHHGVLANICECLKDLMEEDFDTSDRETDGERYPVEHRHRAHHLAENWPRFGEDLLRFLHEYHQVLRRMKKIEIEYGQDEDDDDDEDD